MDGQKRIIVWVSSILIVGITAIAAWQIATSKTPDSRRTETLSEAVRATDHAKGAITPKATLVEYSDFQCPACGMFYPLIEKIFADHKDTLRFIYRHFPLPQHKNALAAAYASEAAGKQDKFWEMHKLIFENQNDWAETDTATQTFEKYARGLNLNLAKFKTDRDSQETKTRVEHDRTTGLASGVNSTPSFYLNGKKLPNPKSEAEFMAMIEASLK